MVCAQILLYWCVDFSVGVNLCWAQKRQKCNVTIYEKVCLKSEKDSKSVLSFRWLQISDLLAIPLTIACFCIMFATSIAYGCSIMNVILLFIFVIVCCIFWSIPSVQRAYFCVVLLSVLRLFCVSLSSVCCNFHACRVCSDIVSAFFCISIRAGFDMSLIDFSPSCVVSSYVTQMNDESSQWFWCFSEIDVYIKVHKNLVWFQYETPQATSEITRESSWHKSHVRTSRKHNSDLRRHQIAARISSHKNRRNSRIPMRVYRIDMEYF